MQSSSVNGRMASTEAVAEATELFGLIDMDESGSITVKAIRKMLRESADILMLVRGTPFLQPLLKPRTFLATLEQIDKDSDGVMNLEEWIAFTAACVKQQEVETEAGRLFRRLDKTSSTFVDRTPRCLRRALHPPAKRDAAPL